MKDDGVYLRNRHQGDREGYSHQVARRIESDPCLLPINRLSFCLQDAIAANGGHMAHLLVRDLNHKVIGRLKKKAKDNRRSLQGGVKVILEQAAEQMTMTEFRDGTARIRKRLKGRRFSDSTALIHQDRARR